MLLIYFRILFLLFTCSFIGHKYSGGLISMVLKRLAQRRHQLQFIHSCKNIYWSPALITKYCSIMRDIPQTVDTNLKFIFSLFRDIKSRILELEFEKSTYLWNLSQNRKLLYQIMLKIIACNASLKQSNFHHCGVWVGKQRWCNFKGFFHWYTIWLI